MVADPLEALAAAGLADTPTRAVPRATEHASETIAPRLSRNGRKLTFCT
jgi:hypothetical protein